MARWSAISALKELHKRQRNFMARPYQTDDPFDDLAPVSRILKGHLYLGGVDALDYMSVRPLLHVACAMECPPDRDGPEGVVFIPLDDDARVDWLSDPLWVRRVMQAGHYVGEWMQQGRVLVTCAMGINRSGMVAALGLCHIGLEPQEAIDLLRDKRSPWVLCNGQFVRVVLACGPSMSSTT